MDKTSLENNKIINSNKRNRSRSKGSFLSKKGFLFFIAAILLAISFFLWDIQVRNNLSQLKLTTSSIAIFYSNKAESMHRSIYNALNRLSHHEIPDEGSAAEEWENDASFYIDSFKGIRTIVWVDENLFIRSIVPFEGNRGYLNKNVTDVQSHPTDFDMWISVYDGTEIKGFVLGTINFEALFSSIIADIENKYQLQLFYEGETVFISENWKHPRTKYVVNKSIILQDTAVLNLTIAPTGELIKDESKRALITLVFSLMISTVTIIAIKYAQNFNKLSHLNATRYRTLLEEVELIAVIIDIKGHITFCNDYLLHMTGWGRHEVIGQDWFKQFHAMGWEQVRGNFLSALARGNIEMHNEILILNQKGETHWVNFHNTILRDTQNNLIGVVILGEDISQRRQSEIEIRNLNEQLEERVLVRTAQLEAANKELEAFSYSVSHDLRSPLRGIDGWSLALLEDYGSQFDEKASTYLNRVRSETQRMGRLIDDLLNLSRLVRVEMQIRQVNLSTVAKDTASQLQEEKPDRHVSVTIQPDLIVNADLHLMEILFTNLLDNAFKFTSKTQRAHIEFGQTTIEGKKAFFVSDNGAGFDMAYADKLFVPFQRLHKESDFPGSGIGLTIVQRIVHRHEGRIWVEAALSRGTIFYFTLERNK